MKARVSLGVDVGGKDAHAATSVPCAALRGLLEQECQGPYGSTFDEFALVLRIDGSVQSWGKSGVDNVRLQRKARYATADVFVPAKIWSAGDSSTLRQFFSTGVESAIGAIADRARKEKDSVEADRLIADVKRATTKFLG
jgi:hypothetical protein